MISQDGLRFDMFVQPVGACMCVCTVNHRERVVCLTDGSRSFKGWQVCRPCHDVLRGICDD